jgi:hypothetical protein
LAKNEPEPPPIENIEKAFLKWTLPFSYKDGIIFVEAKYLAPVSVRTTHGSRRGQIIRYLDLAAYHHLNHPDGVKELYFVLIIDNGKPP